MTDPAAITPIAALAHVCPDFLDMLDPVERLVLPYMHDLWLRPDQRMTRRDWLYHGWLTGRGWGKTTEIIRDLSKQIDAGEIRKLVMVAPTEPRVQKVQRDYLIDMSPPWAKAEPVGDLNIEWPNGARAEGFSSETPGRTRGGNFDAAWLTEIVDWHPVRRMSAFANVTTATRVGRAHVYWDTTSMGRNPVIQILESLHREDPRTYPIKRGDIFDNPLLGRTYLRAECAKYAGRTFEEELLGRVFAETKGAQFRQAWLDDHRVREAPPLDVTIVALDPALSAEDEADRIGLGVLGRGRRDGHVYFLADLTDHYSPEEWGDLAIEQYFARGASGAVIERARIGDSAVFVLRARAKERGLKVVELPRTKDRPFPTRQEGVFYVREYVAAQSKSSRAEGPAAETEAGRVHLVGAHHELEQELTTYEPGTRRSPNRYDVFVYGVIELADLALERRRPSAPDAQTAREAQAQIRNRLLTMGAGRRVGL